MHISESWVLAFIGTLVSGIAALAGYFAWQNRKIVEAFFHAIPDLTEVMKDMVKQMKRHDELSCKSHESQLGTLREISTSLHRLNRNGTGGSE